MRKESTFLSISLLIMVLILAGLHLLLRYEPKYPIVTLDRGWTVTYHNEHYLNTNLEHLGNQLDTSFSKGDILILNLTEPLHSGPVPFPYIMFKSFYCAQEIYLDDELIDQKFTDDISGSTFVGVGYNSVKLPSDFDGKKLSIVLFVTENDSRVDIVSPKLGNYDDLYRDMLNFALFPAFTSIFMVLFGFVFLMISINHL